MKFGARLYGTDPDALAVTARLAEHLGFESLWRGEHLVLPQRLDASASPYPYSADGTIPFSSDAPLLDVLLVYAYVAAATTSIRLATGVYLVALRDPVVTARAVATLDVLSGGRVIFGVGTGWLAEEFALLGIDFSTRGRRTSEVLGAITRLWTEQAPSFEGETVVVPPLTFEPKPVQTPHPPIVVGGESPAALRRAARYGDGWYAHKLDPAAVRTARERLDTLRAEYGRSHRPFEVTIRATPSLTIDEALRFSEAGVDRIVLETGHLGVTDSREDAEELERFAAEVIAAVPGGPATHTSRAGDLEGPLTVTQINH